MQSMRIDKIEPPNGQQLAAGKTDGKGIVYRPYWWDALTEPQASPVAIPQKCDVAIVGSGFTGLSAALTLLRHGRQVMVFERNRVAFWASTRNGGQIGSGNQKFRVKKLIALRGRKKAEEMLREGTRMLDHIAALISEEKIECHFRRAGRLRAAVRKEHYEAMAADLRDLQEIAGVESFMVPANEQHAEIGTDVFFGGSVLPNDASLHPGLYHEALLQRIRAAGGIIFDHTAVENISSESREFRVRTSRGITQARNVIIATNGYTDGLPRAGTSKTYRSDRLGAYRDGGDSARSVFRAAAEKSSLREY
jgi:glycine/D-amino acid oxidase-like deaminating enzyme